MNRKSIFTMMDFLLNYESFRSFCVKMHLRFTKEDSCSYMHSPGFKIQHHISLHLFLFFQIHFLICKAMLEVLIFHGSYLVLWMGGDH